MLAKSPSTHRKAVNLSVDVRLVEDAKELGLNVSRAAEEGIAKAVREEKSRLWKIENKDAIDAYNRYIQEHGLPLTKYRMF